MTGRIIDSGGTGAGGIEPVCHGRALDARSLASLLECDADWIWETDARHRISYLSDSYFDVTGIDPARVVGRSLEQLLNSPQHGGDALVHFDHLQARQPFRGFTCEVKDGRTRSIWVSLSGFPRFDAAGTFQGYLGVGRDITGLSGALDAPLEASSRLAETMEKARLAEAVINAVPNAMFVKDAQLDFVLCNQAFADFFETTPEEMLGRNARDFLEPDAAAEFEASERRVLDTGALYEIEEDFEFRDASRSRIVRKNRVRTSSGKDYVAGSIFDVTDLKRRERESRRTRSHLENVLESLPAGVIIYDSDDRFVLANRQLQETLPALIPAWEKGCTFRTAVELGHAVGYFRLSGDPAVDALYDTDRDAWVEAYMKRHELPHSSFERHNPDGRWYQAIDTRAPDGTFIGIRTDITELKQREAELHEARHKAVLADRAKSEFLANMSHEIRTPMNGVMGMAELLAKTDLDARQKTFTDIIVKSGNALLTIINDILDFSKIDAGQLVLDPAPFRLAEVIEDVATLISTRAKEKDLELIVRVQPGLNGTYVGDVGRIRQIITNLMGNAVKFTESGHVLVDVTGQDRGADTMLHIAVTDTGIGIPEEKLRQVFEKFSQVDTSSTRRHEGTGLGLAITSRLVEMMGGDVGVSSKEGEGSTFWFTIALPRTEDSSREKTMPIDVSGARILVIDDNEVNRSILLEQMASWGFDACAAANGPEGIAVLNAVAAHGLRVDCVVLDYQMPGMTGADVAREVRATSRIAQTPIVMLTSVDQSLGQPGFRGLDIDAHLIKPARSSALLEAIVSTIQKHRGGLLSQAEDVGPAVMEPAPAPVARRPELRIRPRPSDARHRVDILVAEDNEVNQLVFTQILSETPHTFEIVGTGRLAVEARKTMNPRMILMDVSMPEMGGLEATGKIREAESLTGDHVPIVGVTAHALKGDRERCLEAGMDDYLSKPISPKALMQKIERWIGEEEASDQIAG